MSSPTNGKQSLWSLTALIGASLLLLANIATAQQATPIRSVTTLPATCKPGGGTGGAPADHVDLWNGSANTPYYCDAANHWSVAGANAAGPVFNLRNYGCVADDSTDNATCLANWAAAVNAYAGPSGGTPIANCDMGPGDKAYLTSGTAVFTVPVTVTGNCTFDAKNTLAGPVIQLGPTGLSNFSAAQMPPYTVDGLTFIGGSGGATAIEFEKYISEVHIMHNNFMNFGSSASTSWAINSNGGQNNEVHIIDNLWWAYDSTSGRNGFRCVDTTGNSETCNISFNSLNAGTPPGFGAPCGGDAIRIEGSHVTMVANDIYGFAQPYRIGNTATTPIDDIEIYGGAVDNATCANNAVQVAVAFGDAGNISNSIGGPVRIMGIRYTLRAGNALFGIAGDNTSAAPLANSTYAIGNASVGGTGTLTAVPSYQESRDNVGFAADTAQVGSFLNPVILRKTTAPATPPTNMISFFANSGGNERGLCHVDSANGFTLCYGYGPVIQTGTTPGTAISAQTCQDTNITVTNSFAAGQTVIATPSSTLGANWANIIWNAYISANGTVTLHICNPTGGSLTPAAQTFYIKVIQ